MMESKTMVHKKSKPHWRLVWDISALTSLLMLIIGGTSYFTRENARVDYLSDRIQQMGVNVNSQIADVRNALDKQNDKIDKIYEIVSQPKK